jgi:hypothetical protein
MKQRALDRTPSLSVLLTNDYYIGRDQEPSQNSAEARHLPKTIIDLVLDHQEVEITAIVRVPPRTRTKQDHLRRGRGRVDQGATRTVDRLIG